MAPDSDAARSSEINTENPTAEELVARARALITSLRSRTAKCEEERRIRLSSRLQIH